MEGRQTLCFCGDISKKAIPCHRKKWCLVLAMSYVSVYNQSSLPCSGPTLGSVVHIWTETLIWPSYSLPCTCSCYSCLIFFLGTWKKRKHHHFSCHIFSLFFFFWCFMQSLFDLTVLVCALSCCFSGITPCSVNKCYLCQQLISL